MHIPFRFWIGVIIFMTTYTNYVMRVNISISALAMMTPKESENAQNKTEVKTSDCIVEKKERIKKEYHESDIFPRAEWTETQQGQVLAGYGYGYMIFSIPGGFLAEYFGPWKTIFWSTLGSIFATLLCVPANLVHWSAVMLVRVLIGMLGGVHYPALQNVISHWSPPKEKGKFMSAMFGNTMGTVMTFAVVGAISDVANWVWGFVFVASFASLYLILVAIVLSDSPEKSRWCSEEEKEYISSQLPPPKRKLIAPYKDILTSRPFWGLAICHLANLWGLFVLLTSVPKFFNDYLDFSLKESGALSAAPHIVRLLAGFLYGCVNDFFTKRAYCSMTIQRKGFVVFSHLLPSLCMFAMMFIGCNAYVGTVLLCMTLFFNAAEPFLALSVQLEEYHNF
ncbi:sialin isoform X2 [Aethina tumida]|uniref:sialin isoform X2 n=1 Tax=Aethina tumida TaxID=116153 RepID=UPI002148B548|nr:sialin isoform X2 [Aethina tumida]